MTRRGAVAVLALLLAPVASPAIAQTTVDGSAEWTVASNTSRSNDQTNRSSAFSQNYSLGYSRALWDPRLVRFNTQGLFRTSSLTSGGTARPNQQGRQGDLGYKFGASVLPGSPLPFFIQAARTASTSSGELGPSNPIRSGMIAPSGAPPIDYESRANTVNLGGQVGLGGLPKIEYGYRRGHSVTTGGGYQAEQHDGDVYTSAAKVTTRTRQSFRYQRTSFDNLLAQTFVQRLNNLDYDLGVMVFEHTRLTAHGGRRTTFSRSEFASTLASPGDGAYTPPPSQGSVAADYALAGIDYEPSGRFSLRMNSTVDRQTGQPATTTARLASISSHVEAVRGLTLTGTGMAGSRGQIAGGTPVTVSTRNAVGGATYQARVRRMSGNVSGSRGLGTNGTQDGRRGSTSSWSTNAGLWTNISQLSLSAGYDRGGNHDDLLDYGNYLSQRVRGSVLTGTPRFSLSLDGERLNVERGQDATLARNVQHTYSTSASFRAWRDSVVSVTAGGFTNQYDSGIGAGRDRSLFWSVGSQAMLRPTLRLSAWVRNEGGTASKSGFDQRTLNAFGRLEYRLRSLSLALEYRGSDGHLAYADLENPNDFSGRQVRFSVSRQFGVVLR